MKSLISALLLLSNVLNAQVHIKNQQFLQFNLGGYDSFVPLSTSFSSGIEWGKYTKKLNSKIVGFAINHKKANGFSDEMLDLKIPVTQYFAYIKSDISFYHNANNIFHIKGIGQLNLGYESINNESKYVNSYTVSKSSDYLLGVGAGLQIEYCPIVIGVTESINFLSKYQKLSTVPYIGFRYHFY